MKSQLAQLIGRELADLFFEQNQLLRDMAQTLRKAIPLLEGVDFSSYHSLERHERKRELKALLNRELKALLIRFECWDEKDRQPQDHGEQ